MWCRASIILIFRQQATLKMKKKKKIYSPHIFVLHAFNTSMFKVHLYCYVTINSDQNRIMCAIVSRQNSRKLSIIAFICLETKSLEKPFVHLSPFLILPLTAASVGEIAHLFMVKLPLIPCLDLSFLLPTDVLKSWKIQLNK